MDDGEFEWDDQKAADNLARHDVSFEAAREAFRDPFGIEHLDDREDYGEDRYALIAMVEGRPAVCRLHPEGRPHSHHIGPRSGAT